MANITRRSFLHATVGSAALAPVAAAAQQREIPPYEPRDWSGNSPLPYPDPDVIALDDRFRRYIIFNTPIRRHFTGTLWAEGPAWNGSGRYVVWSDIPNNRQMRMLEEDGHVTVFRNPSNHSNGNTFDHEGRQLSCQHGGRQVVRYEHSGEVTVIADSYDGKRLSSPNDLAVHPDRSIWFTDPPYGLRGSYEGFRAEAELENAVYRVDGVTGAITKATGDVNAPNGLCFSPNYDRLYVADTGAGQMRVFDVDGETLTNGRDFGNLTVPSTGGRSVADGMRCDVDGNVWCGAAPGVQVLSPEGDQIGMIRLPERCANVCFGGSRRNRLFMTASQSLYSVFVGARGAGIA